MSKFYSLSDLESFIRCPLCGQHYNSKKSRIVKKTDGLIILYLMCSKCQSSAMTMISTGSSSITSVSVITDIIEKDIERFQNQKPISADDVLELHTFLEKK